MDLIACTCSVCGKFALDEDDIEALTQPARINAAFAGRKSGELADAREQLRGAVKALAEAVEVARLFNRGGMTWLEYDCKLAEFERIANASGGRSR